jgi:hypothetical protein
MHRLTLLSFIILVSCSHDNSDLSGSYKMTSQRAKSREMDSTNHNAQMKIYSGAYVMYAQFGPDSMASWGVRKVLPVEGGIRESNVYGAIGSTELATPHIYTLSIERTGNGFRQSIPSLEYRGQTIELTEEYELVEGGIPTPYDGAWKLTDAFIVNGKDTAHLDIVQYKFYQSSSFIFGHALRDSLKNSSSGFGYGHYDMPNDSTLTEYVEVSSYKQIVGKSFNIKVSLDGKDNLLQVVDELEGAKSVERYKRL